MARSWLCVVMVIGCAAPPRPIRNDAEPAHPAAGSGATVPVPDEPWYRDRTEGRRDDCEPPTSPMPQPHFPAPFEACDPRAESFASPPGSSELHFHYRFFSAALTTARRAAAPGVCCYMIWEFPSYR